MLYHSAIITHTGGSRCVDMVISGIGDCVYVRVLTLWKKNDLSYQHQTGSHTVHSSHSACICDWVQKVKVMWFIVYIWYVGQYDCLAF